MASGLVAQAHASPLVNACAKAPYGDTWEHYLQFSIDGAVVSKGNMNIPPAKAGGFADAPEGAQSATRADGYFGSTSAVSTAPISSRAG